MSVYRNLLLGEHLVSMTLSTDFGLLNTNPIGIGGLHA